MVTAEDMVIEDKNDNTDIKKKVKKTSLINQITIEPVVILYTIANAMRSAPMNNLLLEKACKASAGFNSTVCNSVIKGTYREYNFTEENNIVQLYSNSMYAWSILSGSIVGIIITLFLGAYSDKHKIRIPFMLVSTFGELIANGGTVMCAIFMHQLPLAAYGFFGNIIASFFGGWTMMYASFYTYAADISTPETCSIRLAVLHGIFHISLPAGQLFGGFLFKNTGYTVSISLSSIMFTIAFLYTAFMVDEPRKKNIHEENRRNNFIADFCDMQHAIAPFQLLVKMKGGKRLNFLCVLIVLWIIYTVDLGETNVLYLFTQNVYQWTAVTTSYYTAATSAMQIIGISLGVYIFKKVFKLDDLTITFLALFDSLFARIIFLTYRSSIGLYIGELIGTIRRLACISLRAYSKEYISDDDNGKAQSMITSLETLAVMSGGLLYNDGVYAYTESTYPYAIFVLGIVLMLLAIVFTIIMYFSNKKITEEEIET